MQQNLEYKPPHPFSGSPKVIPATIKSTNTFKSLIGVDANGGIVFVSQLYTGSISDKEIVIRSGFLEILKNKVAVGEILAADAAMADKSFNIGDELKKVNLRLNIPPFLANQSAFSEGDAIKTQTVAKRRIHFERATGEVRRFQIFSSDHVCNYQTDNDVKLH